MSFELPDYLDDALKKKLSTVIEVVSKNLPACEDAGKAVPCTSLVNGRVRYDSVWLFTPNLAVQIRDPLRNGWTQHEMAPFAGTVDWIRLTVRDSQVGAANEDASLDIEFTTLGGWSGTLTAVGEACEPLMAVYHERILPNFNPQPNL